MKKKLIVFVLIVLIIIAVVFIIRKINDSKFNYEISKVNSFEYVKFYEKGKYGVLNKDGNIIIPAEYKDIIIPNPEKDVFICNEENNIKKVLNAEKQELFTNYDRVEPIKLKNIASVLCYEKSVLSYEKDGLFGLIDYNGKKITENIYDSIENLQLTEGKLLVSKNNKFGVINIKGTTLVKTEYDNVKTDGYFNEETKYLKAGFIVSNTTENGYKYGYIDYKGKKIINTDKNEIVRIGKLDDIYLIISENGKEGLYKNSKQKIKPEYQSIEYEEESNLLVLEKNKKFGVADLKGKIIIELKYSDIDFRGLYIYASNENENIVYDTKGNKQDINFNKSIYKTENDNYRITTIINNNVFYYNVEDAKGNVIINNNYSYIEYAFKDYFIVKNEKDKIGVINVNGDKLLKFKYSFIQKINGKNVLQALDEKNKTYIYSPDLEVKCKMKNANIDIQNNYFKVYNKNEEKYFDYDGNKIEKDNELIIKNNTESSPDQIGDYEKIQYSLDSAYYVKKENK